MAQLTFQTENRMFTAVAWAPDCAADGPKQTPAPIGVGGALGPPKKPKLVTVLFSSQTSYRTDRVTDVW